MDRDYWIAYAIEDLTKAMIKLELVASSAATQELLIVLVNEISSKLNDEANSDVDANRQNSSVIDFAREKMTRTLPDINIESASCLKSLSSTTI